MIGPSCGERSLRTLLAIVLFLSVGLVRCLLVVSALTRFRTGGEELAGAAARNLRVFVSEGTPSAKRSTV